jgi:alpha-methylacyl-CoA racemase
VADARPPAAEAEGVRRRIADVFATRPAAEWVATLGPQGAAIGMVNRGTDLTTDPQVRARGTLVQVGDVSVPASPIRRRDVTGALEDEAPPPPPTVGHDTRDVLTEAGYSPAEIEELVSDGVVAVG